MIQAYRDHAEIRAATGVPPLPLDVDQTAALVALLKDPPAGEADFLLELFTERVPAGVDKAAYVKASFLSALTTGDASSPLIDRARAVEILGTMLGGYNVGPLVGLLDDPDLGALSADQLKHTLLMFDAFHDVAKLAEAGNANAKSVLDSWAAAEWFTSRDALPEKMSLTVFMVPGETNTDDLSPATEAWSRPDIPLHALAMLVNPREGIHDALVQVAEVKAKGLPVAYVGDVVGTGSSRKSATNSVIWHFGDDIPCVPNKRAGGVCLGNAIAPIFFNTMEDSGALPIECDVSRMEMGDTIHLFPYAGRIENDAGETISSFSLKTDVLLDEVQGHPERAQEG